MNTADQTAHLERRVHRLERFILMLAIGFGVMVIWKFVPGDPTVEARSFVLRDGTGQTRAQLAMWNENRPTLRLNDINGKARAMFFLDPERGAVLRMTDQNGYNRLALELDLEGMPSVRLTNADGRTQTLMTLSTPEQPGVLVLDGSRNTLFSSPLGR